MQIFWRAWAARPQESNAEFAVHALAILLTAQTSAALFCLAFFALHGLAAALCFAAACFLPLCLAAQWLWFTVILGALNLQLSLSLRYEEQKKQLQDAARHLAALRGGAEGGGRLAEPLFAAAHAAEAELRAIYPQLCAVEAFIKKWKAAERWFRMRLPVPAFFRRAVIRAALKLPPPPKKRDKG